MNIKKKETQSNKKITFPFTRISVLKKKKKTQRFPNTNIQEISLIDKNSCIGEYTFIGRDVSITKASIGRYCSIAPHVQIGMGEHDVNLISTSAYLYEGDWYEKLTQKECTIGHDVWIGTESIIRRGIKVGNFSVIGSNSFVNKDVPEFAVVAGSPARVIKYRFTPELREKIKQSNYWEYPPEKAKIILKQILKD